MYTTGANTKIYLRKQGQSGFEQEICGSDSFIKNSATLFKLSNIMAYFMYFMYLRNL